MRILSWNINGVRTLPQYHPWNTFKSFEGILEELQADIICFQEMKASRTTLQQNTAIPGSFDAFFSFPFSKGGYSGVAVYSDSRKVLPLKAEEGLSGRIQPKPPLLPAERVSLSYPHAHEMEMMPDEQGNTPSDLVTLDSEGRALVLDFGLFVLINVYCPNETSDARLPFKMNYHLMLQERVHKLIAEGREVVVVGDMNICATPLDHCDGHLPSNASNFWEHPARSWFRNWLEPDGPMVDIVRRYWPERKGMYTCWNTKICARETNYGTRVDYILVTQGLLKWIKNGDTSPSKKGSDHCPIYIDFHDEITTDSGEVVTLRDAMKFPGTGGVPPRLASKFWIEYSGKQKLLSSFFGKQSNVEPISAERSRNESAVQLGTSNTLSLSHSLPSSASDLASDPNTSTQPITPPAARFSSEPNDSGGPSSKPSKRKESREATLPPKTKKLKSGQAKLSNFFTKPIAKGVSSASSEVLKLDGDDTVPSLSVQNQLESDYRLACELSTSQEDVLAHSEAVSTFSSSSSSSQNNTAWSQLFAPVQPPKCLVHGESAKMFTVNKPGPNKGKTFFICSRPVGPGYDKGKANRLRDEVDHQYRCNFFKWASEVKRETLQQSKVNKALIS